MARDPRSIITPDAFTVAPELLGYALARPGRRLAAIALDGLLATVLAKSGYELLAGIAVALLVWRVVAGPIERIVQGRGRLFFRGASVVLALIVFVNAWNGVQQAVGGRMGGGNEQKRGDGKVNDLLDELNLSATEQASFVTQLATLEVGDSAKVPARAAQLAAFITTHTEPGDERDELVTAVLEAVPESGRPAFQNALGMDTVPATDSLAIARAQNARLERANARLERELRDVRARSERRASVRTFLGDFFDDLGIGFGWFALYFTAFVVLGRGQTPGKRMLGIKIIRLDNRPIGWWLAFERFGGYAASFSTGLLGFAQILWDRNRQALHDKATETVVIRLVNGQPVKVI